MFPIRHDANFPGKTTWGCPPDPRGCNAEERTCTPEESAQASSPASEASCSTVAPGVNGGGVQEFPGEGVDDRSRQGRLVSIQGREGVQGVSTDKDGPIGVLQSTSGLMCFSPAKPSRPSRAYIHVVASDHIAPLSDKVRQTSFLDAQNTASDPVLLAPPSLEFAPYAKIPGNRVRKDARQGTIDQDPEFFAFLESLTQPVSKPNAAETTTNGEEKKNTMTTTPLVQYIKDKKANKAKEQAAAKSSRRSDKENKSEKVQAKKLLQRPDRDSANSSTTDKTEKKSKADKATKDAVKAANKQAANAVSKQSGKGSTNTPNASKETPTAPASERKRDRGNAAAAAKILQRDLGISQSGGRRKGGKGASAENDAPKKEPATAPTEPKKDAQIKSPKGPAQGKGKGNENAPETSDPAASTPPPSTSNTAKPGKSSKGKQAAAATTTSPNPTATQAFLKHANPSQGVTEELLEAAFIPFGAVVKVEIDRKKGFGYIDFAEPSGLRDAIAASPVPVAQSQVVVLERKANPGGEKARGKGQGQQATGGSSGSGGANANGSRGGKEGGGSSRGPRSRGRNKGASKGKEGEKAEAK